MRKPAAKDQSAERFSLRRWAQRKLEAARAEPVAAAPAAAPVVPAATPSTPPSSPEAAALPSLPPIESLTIDSDFTLFMQPHVDASVRRAALKQLFRDPRFNVMDGLDVYIDDYTKPDPMPEDLVKQLAHARAIFDPPPTTLNAEGHVVDAPATLPAAAGQVQAPSAAGGASPASRAPDSAAPADRHEGPTGNS